MQWLVFLLFVTLTTALSLRLRDNDGVKFCPPSCADKFNACKLVPAACADEACGVLNTSNQTIWRPSPCRSCNFCQGRVGDAADNDVSADDAAVNAAAKAARQVEQEAVRCAEHCKTVPPRQCRKIAECRGCQWCPFPGWTGP
ncbi:uncharacterized protein CC84DRAFT_1222600 [Paraphaeosphaeria sporulosa]|uniref:Uncharacterized protein n=1 Tax=Paraphaeosphaeria sporulosa TaxID=1460663 RepID=A0A177BY08_9PLEO|nr:uncharacterized protein CC84DRAFT_1222600 [Paraphaeosphaeria sporulosa]OAF99581.1 hypothetical protein CC84DRAFT_1222600 [Paraphaeosphaeria sporulosa]